MSFVSWYRFVPRPGSLVPESIEKIMHEIIDGSDHPRDDLHPYSVKVPIQVKFDEKLLERIYGSDDPNVQRYLKQNPGFLDKFGLLVVIGVSFKNICGTILNLIRHFCNKKNCTVL